MDENRKKRDRNPSVILDMTPLDAPRRLKLPAREIGIALALTLAAAAQLAAAFYDRKSGSGPSAESEPATLAEVAR
jgi:hypothetical protein